MYITMLKKSRESHASALEALYEALLELRISSM